MTLDKAIEIKEQYHEKYRVHMLSDERDADLMSIEALKRERKHREGLRLTKPELLPGEEPE